MKKVVVVMVLVFFSLVSVQTMAKKGVITGGELYSIPNWFKLSFLDLMEEAKDAGKAKKHVILFMHLKACPYCARMLDENFRRGSNKAYMQKKFDVIAINIRGDKEVSWKGGATLSEKSFARKMGVFATPTIVFLDNKGNKVLQLNGYRNGSAFRDVLEYMQARVYRNMSLAKYVQRKNRKAIYQFLPHASLKTVINFHLYKKPLLVIFSNRDCADCAEFHKKVLNHKSVLLQLKKYLVVRLDSYSTAKITSLSGKRITATQWAKELGLNYRPGIALFNDGKLVSLINGRYYHFHFKENLRYVSGRHYYDFASFPAYLNARQRELLRKGTSIDLSE